MVLAYDGYSDADPKHRPSGAQWIQCDTQWVQRVYLAKIAQKFMEDSGQAEAGTSTFCIPLPYDMISAANIITFGQANNINWTAFHKGTHTSFRFGFTGLRFCA